MGSVCEKCGGIFAPDNGLCPDCDLAETHALYEEVTQLRAKIAELERELAGARVEIERLVLEIADRQYTIVCAAQEIADLRELLDEAQAEIEQYKMGKVSPADYYSMAEAERELCNEIAELKQKYSEMNEERIKWLGDNMKQAKLIEQMREVLRGVCEKCPCDTRLEDARCKDCDVRAALSVAERMKKK